MNTLSWQAAEDWAIEHRNVVLVLLGTLLYVAFLGQRDLWYPDEPDIAEVTRAMFLSGDWIFPRRMGEIWVDYPPMIYWVGALSSSLFGDMSAFSLRLPNALAAIMTVIVTGAAAERWFGQRTAFWAGIVLLTFLTFVYEANSYRPDVVFTLMITAGMIAYAEGAGDVPRLLLRIVAFACFGVAMLAKGPLGLLLPGLVLVLWHGGRREWRQIFWLAPLAIIAVLVYLPWFVATAQGMGWDSMLYEFYAQNFERFMTSAHRGHAQPWYYYIRNFWIDFTPWSWLLPVAVGWLLHSERWRDPKVQLALWWFGTFFVFLSIASTKRQLYLLPAYPAVALLMACWLASLGRARTGDGAATPGVRPLRIYSLALAVGYSLIGIAALVAVANLEAIIAASDLNEQELEIAAAIPIPLVLTGLVLLGSGIWMWRSWRRHDVGAAIAGIAVGHIVLYVVILSMLIPTLGPSKTYAPQSQWISEQIGAETRFGMVDPNGLARRGGFSYYTGTMVDLLTSPAEVENFLQQHPSSVVLIIEASAEEIFAADKAAWQARVLRELRVGRHLYVVVGGSQLAKDRSFAISRKRFRR